MDIEILTRIVLERSPHLTREDARLKALEYRRLHRRLEYGWRKSLELLILAYLYDGLDEAEAAHRAQQLRPGLQKLDRTSQRSRRRFLRLCHLTPAPHHFLDGEP